MTAEPHDARGEDVPRKGSILGAFRAVAWGFFGVRKSSGLERDASELKPAHVIIAAIVAAALFIAALIALVSWVTRSGVAA